MSDIVAEKPGSDVPVDVEHLDHPDTTDYTESTDTTWKTWIVIFVLASSVGVSFWPVPTTSPMLGTIAAQFDSPTSSSWYLSSFTTGISRLSLPSVFKNGTSFSEICSLYRLRSWLSHLWH